ncbi:hypothetical protein EI427_25180 [Flammeovirga pectinis]|uniref:Uncharacterized protein n=1 Tax=Flammeovirga pectinis TaxID=2494373 RepID=A0A3S9PBK4_9BACT|nr:hypothetical protein [Flammeovirga pectinis]AZQ65509.1 hypothetical protein EI427_25180 [Flammeovirga pectinis]
MIDLPTLKCRNYLTKEWQEKYVHFLQDEHWNNFINQLQLLITQSNSSLRVPYFSEEVTLPLDQVLSEIIKNYPLTKVKNSEEAWAIALMKSPFQYLLIILGQRCTSASCTDEKGIPPLKATVLNSSLLPYNEQISTATRAWEKHAGRHEDNFWGEVKGSPSQKETHVRSLIKMMLDTKTWWNVFFHYKHGHVYEIRIASGHGIRWSDGGKQLIGFLEPFIND